MAFDYGDEIMLIFVGLASLLILARALFGREAMKDLMKMLNFDKKMEKPRIQTGKSRDRRKSSRGILQKKDPNHCEIIMKGYLLKKGSKIQGCWRQRYFTLNSQSKLQYYANENDLLQNSAPKGGMVVIRVVPITHEGREDAMSIEGTFGSAMIAAAETADIQNDWLVAFNQLFKPNSDMPAIGSPRHTFETSIAAQSSPVLHKLDIQVATFTGAPQKVKTKKVKQYYIVCKVKSEIHDLSKQPVGQTNSIKGSMLDGGMITWENEYFSWSFQDHECATCMECKAGAASALHGEKLRPGMYYKGLPHKISCQLWEATMLRDKKVATGKIDLVDLFDYPNIEQSTMTCTWPLYNADGFIGDMKLQFKYEAEHATGKEPFLSSCTEELKPVVGEEKRTIKPIETVSDYFDKILADGVTLWDPYYEAREDTEVQTENWQESSQYGGKIRRVTFRSLTHSPIGPASTMTTSTQHVCFSDDTKELRFSRKIVLHDIPYGDCFSVEQLSVATEDRDGLYIQEYLAVPFTKGCMWKSKIIGNTTTSVAESTDLLYKTLNQAMGDGESTANPKRRLDRTRSLLDETVALREIFENQRLSIIGGWGPGHLLPTDRPRFTNRKGDVEMNFDIIELPPGWVWTSSWKIDHNYTACDEEGWSYASDFPRFKSHLQKGKSNAKKLGSSVRRRRWIRTLCRGTETPTE